MLTPLDPKEWDLTKAAHLLNRAGFGGTPADGEAVYQQGFNAAVERFLSIDDDGITAPAWATPQDLLARRKEYRALSGEERKMKQRSERQIDREQMNDLIAWWMGRMQQSATPLREKLTLFWHGHFATSVRKVKEPYMMWRQNQTLREHALGSFGAMVKAVSRDPAMMRWLDTAQSNKQHPNENFARELMELFTLGIGNYSEEDVQQAARAFTGYRIDMAKEAFHSVPRQHDGGEKMFLGKRARYDGDGVIDRILEQPASARFIVHKLWEFFVYEEPAGAIIDALAQTFRQANYAIRPVMLEIFRSAEFYSPAAIRTQIKSPVQWVVQTARQLQMELPRPVVLSNVLRQLGQVPFAPPSVKGWDGGKAWITTSGLLLRYNLAGLLVGVGPGGARENMRRNGRAKKGGGGGGMMPMGTRVPLREIAPVPLRENTDALVAQLSMRLFQTVLPERETQTFTEFVQQHQPHTSDDTIRGLLHLMMSTPRFQLT